MLRAPYSFLKMVVKVTRARTRVSTSPHSRHENLRAALVWKFEANPHFEYTVTVHTLLECISNFSTVTTVVNDLEYARRRR